MVNTYYINAVLLELPIREVAVVVLQVQDSYAGKGWSIRRFSGIVIVRYAI
jgi:hypothetical protein